MADAKPVVRKRKRERRNVSSGIVHIKSTFNNTIVSITDPKGQVIAWSSAGKCNFRGSRKSTAYAAQVVAQDAARNAMSHGLKDIVIRVSGPGLGRDSAIRALQAIGPNALGCALGAFIGGAWMMLAGAAAAAARPLGTFAVKGRAEPVAIFALDSPGAGTGPAGLSEFPFPSP